MERYTRGLGSAGVLNVGVANGVAPLDSSAHLARTYRPDLDRFNVKDPAYGAVGDGVTDDTAALQAAKTAAGVSGGELFFPPGTYLSSSVLVLGANTTVRGVYRKSVVKAITNSHNVFQSSQPNVAFYDISIDLNKASTATPGSDTSGNGIYWAPVTTGAVGLVAERVHVYNGHTAGIRCFGQSGNNVLTLDATNVTIRDCVIESVDQRGIYISGCTRPRLEGNTCRSCGQDGIVVLLSRNVHIHGNLIEDITGVGIAPQYFDGLQVSENTIRRCSQWGVAVGGGDPAKTVNNMYAVVGNIVEDSGYGGITNDPTLSNALNTPVGVHAVLTDNICSGSAQYHGIYLQLVRNAVVANNECFDNFDAGISAHGRDLLLVGNHCWGNDRGIALEALAATVSPGNVMLAANHCHDNTTANYTTSTYYTNVRRLDNELLTFPTYTTLGRPDASTVPVGTGVYDTTLGRPVWSTGSAWSSYPVAGSDVTNTPAGGIAATTVQAALNELDTEKAALAGASFAGAVAGTTFSGTSAAWTSFVSSGSNVAASGTVRLQNNTSVTFRNAANSADIPALTTDTSNRVLVGSSPSNAVLLLKGTGVVCGGATTVYAKLGGTIFDHSNDVGNGTTVETDLYSDSIPASTLDTNGHKIEAVYAGTFAANTTTKQLKVLFGGTTIFDSGALAVPGTASTWTLQATLVRVSASVVRCAVAFDGVVAAAPSYTEVTGLTLTNAQVLKVTGTAGAGGANNDIVAKLGTVRFRASA